MCPLLSLDLSEAFLRIFKYEERLCLDQYLKNGWMQRHSECAESKRIPEGKIPGIGYKKSYHWNLHLLLIQKLNEIVFHFGFISAVTTSQRLIKFITLWGMPL